MPRKCQQKSEVNRVDERMEDVIRGLKDELITFKEDMSVIYKQEFDKLNSSITEFKDIIGKQQKDYEQLLVSMNEIKTENVDLKNEIFVLKNRIQDVNHENLISEVHERTVRANNLIFYDVEESASSSIQTKIEEDKNKVEAILRQLNIENGVERVIRLGRKVSNRNRPAKVTLKDRSLVLQALKAKRNKRDSNISIAADSTPLQREFLKNVREALAERQRSGETDLTIKYVRDIPTIIKKKN